MLIGYARVSTTDQTLSLQEDALTKAGCDQIYTDTASGASTERPGLQTALSHLRAGDILVVWRLDRLGRSLPHLIETIKGLDKRGIGFQSVTEHIDTTTSGGKLIFHIFGALAEFERDIIRERTQAGLQAARARGTRRSKDWISVGSAFNQSPSTSTPPHPGASSFSTSSARWPSLSGISSGNAPKQGYRPQEHADAQAVGDGHSRPMRPQW
jgi:Resolvase, N terminal domain